MRNKSAKEKVNKCFWRSGKIVCIQSKLYNWYRSNQKVNLYLQDSVIDISKTGMGIAVRIISTINGALLQGNMEMAGQKMVEFLMTIQATMKAQLYAHSVDAEVIIFVFDPIFIFESS